MGYFLIDFFQVFYIETLTMTCRIMWIKSKAEKNYVKELSRLHKREDREKIRESDNIAKLCEYMSEKQRTVQINDYRERLNEYRQKLNEYREILDKYR